MKNEELIKKEIEEKDKAKIKYKQKLNDIKQHYGIEFDVEHFNTNKIRKVKFINLNYRKEYINLCVIYDGVTKNIDYIDYNYTDSWFIKNANHKVLVPNLEKEFKLKLVLAEIDRANNEYIKVMEKLDKKEIKENTVAKEKSLKVNKNEEN